MRDLYAELGLDPMSTNEEIASTLKQNPAMAAHATILLNGKKRAVYDRSWFTLKTIGTLRHRLGLDTDETWFLREYPAFAPGRVSSARTDTNLSSSAPSTESTEQIQQRGGVETKKSPVKRLALIGLSLAALIALFLILR